MIAVALQHIAKKLSIIEFSYQVDGKFTVVMTMVVKH